MKAKKLFVKRRDGSPLFLVLTFEQVDEDEKKNHSLSFCLAY